jgi:hypothetical protein
MIKVNLRFLGLTFFYASTNSRPAPAKNYRGRFHRGNSQSADRDLALKKDRQGLKNLAE